MSARATAARRAKAAARKGQPAPGPVLGELRPHLAPPAAPPSNVIPFAPRPSWGEAAAVLQSTAPAAAAPGNGAPVAGLPTRAPPAPAPSTEIAPRDNQLLSEMAATAVTAFGVAVISSAIEKRGLEPSPPADDEIELCEEHTAAAIARGLGDAEVPWYVPLLIAWAKLGSGMYMSAKQRAAHPEATTTSTPEPDDVGAFPTASSSAPSSSAPTRAQGGSVPYSPLRPLQKAPVQS